MDESLDGLDTTVREQVLETLLDRAAPWTLLVVTHDEAVRRRCDRELILAPVERNGVGGHFAGHAH